MSLPAVLAAGRADLVFQLFRDPLIANSCLANLESDGENRESVFPASKEDSEWPHSSELSAAVAMTDRHS